MQKNEFDNRANVVRLNNLRIAPRKVRVVVDMVRNMGVEEALAVLQFSHKKAAHDVAKMIESGVANIQLAIPSWAGEDLFVARAFVDAGPTLRRFMPRAQGRAFRVRKRTSHITVVVGAPEDGAKATKAPVTGAVRRPATKTAAAKKTTAKKTTAKKSAATKTAASKGRNS